MYAGHPTTSSNVLHPRGETEALFYSLLSASLHFDQYVFVHALLIAALLAAPLFVNQCHISWQWLLLYLKVGKIRLLSFIRINILHRLPPPGRPPEWRRRLPYYMMRRFCRRRFKTKTELLQARALPILVGAGALPYSHESLHEFICTLDPLVIPRLLKNDGPWIRSSSKAKKERKMKRHRRRKALRTASALKYVLQPDDPDPSCVSTFTAYDTGQSVYLGLDSAKAPIVVDLGASLSITPHTGDFIGKIEQLDTTIQGISSVTKIKGAGTVRWHLEDIVGTIKIIETRAYYIHDAGVRLFSPQVYSQEQQAGSYIMTSTGTVLTTSNGCELTFGY
jgi:hypothetical protein